MNSVNEKPAFALVRDVNGNIVKQQLTDLCDVPALVWNVIAKRVLDGQATGRFYPLDPLDVYNSVVKSVLQARQEMPVLNTASPETYLCRAVDFAFLGASKRVVVERNNQRALLDVTPTENADDDDGEEREERVVMHDHGYAPLYEAIASLESRQMRIAAWTYLDPSVDGNLYACARAAGVAKSRFYSSFWPMTLRALRRKLES